MAESEEKEMMSTASDSETLIPEIVHRVTIGRSKDKDYSACGFAKYIIDILYGLDHFAGLSAYFEVKPGNGDIQINTQGLQGKAATKQYLKSVFVKLVPNSNNTDKKRRIDESTTYDLVFNGKTYNGYYFTTQWDGTSMDNPAGHNNLGVLLEVVNQCYRGTFKTQSRMHKDCIRFLEKVSG